MAQATLSRREAAERLGIHYNSMRMWEKKYAEVLRPEKVVIGNVEQVRIPVEGVEKLLEQEGGSSSMPRRSSPRSRQFANNPTAQALSQELEAVKRKNADLALRNAELEAEARGLRDQVKMLEGFIERIDRAARGK